MDVAKELRAGQIHEIRPRAHKMTDSCGPRAALRQLQVSDMSEIDRRCWVEKARLDAVLGGKQKSMKGLKSALACYVSFMSKCDFFRCYAIGSRTLCWAGAVFPSTTSYFPPSLRALLAWSVLFRSAGTLRNYFGFVKTGCMIAGVSTEVRYQPYCRAAVLIV